MASISSRITEPRRRALQRGLEQADQIFGLFLDFEFQVADDAEGALALDGVAAGNRRPMNRPVACSSGIRCTAPSLPGGMRMKRSILPGMRISAFIGLPSDDPRQLQRDGEAEARDERERVRRIDRQRRQQREDVAEEVILEPAALRLGEVVAVDQRDAGLRQGGAQIAPDRLLVGGEFETVLLMRTSCSAGVMPSGLRSAMPSRTCALIPATRTMKNSSRLLAEIDRNRTRSSTGWPGLTDSSSTRRLKCSQDSSRLMNRSGLVASGGPRLGSFLLFQ